MKLPPIQKLHCGWLLLAVLLPLTAVAEMPEAWAEAFAKLDALNLPDVSSATLVIPDTRHTALIPGGQIAYAWLMQEHRNTEGGVETFDLISDGVRRLCVKWSEQEPKRSIDADILGFDKDNAPSIYVTPPPPAQNLRGTWRETDSADRVAFMRSTLREARGNGNPVRRLQARALIFAYQLWSRGETDAALPLLVELEQADDDPGALLLDAIQVLADAEYTDVYWAWLETYDWEAYARNIQRLLDVYGTDWRRNTSFMQQLLKQVKQRIAHDAQSAPDDLAQRILSVRAMRNPEWPKWDKGMSTWWLFPDTWSNQVPLPLDAEMEIYQLGIHAIPLLLSLANDSMPAEMDHIVVTRARDAYYFRWAAFPFMDVPVDAPDALPRPATRGEMAHHWLRLLLPQWMGYEATRRRNTPTVLLEFAESFYATFRDASEVEVAIQYLSGRFSGFHPPVKNKLLDLAKIRPLPELERFLMETSWPQEGGQLRAYELKQVWQAKNQMLVEYVLIRGEEARPLLAQFRAVTEQYIQEETALAEDESKHQHQRESAQKLVDYLREMLPQLEKTHASLAFVRLIQNAQDVEEQIAVDPDFDFATLEGQIHRLEGCIRLEALLALSALSPNRRGHAAWRLGLNPEWAADCPSTTGANYWRMLIQPNEDADSTKTADDYLTLHEQLFGTVPPEALTREIRYSENPKRAWAAAFLKQHGSGGREWLRRRVELRLDGVPEDELPQYENVEASLAQPVLLEELAARFEAVRTREEAGQTVAVLSPIQRMALPILLQERFELNARLFGLASIIESVEVQEDIPEEIGERLLAWKGKPIEPHLADELETIARECAGQDRHVSIRLVFHADFVGCTLSIQAAKIPEHLKEEQMLVVGYRLLIYAPDIYAFASCRVIGEPPDNRWAFKTSDAFGQKELQWAKDGFFSTVPPTSEERALVIQTIQEKHPADKIEIEII